MHANIRPGENLAESVFALLSVELVVGTEHSKRRLTALDVVLTTNVFEPLSRIT